MKIGLVCPYNMHRGGGVQECVKAIQAELKNRGHEALIITPSPRNAPDTQLTDVLYVGGATDIKTPLHTTAQVSFTANSESLDELQEHHKFDVLHFHEPWVPFMSRQLLRKSNSINIATFHARLPDTVMSKTIERVITPYTKSVLKYLDAFTAVSDAAAQYVSDLTDEPIQIIPNGIDLKHFTAKPAKLTSFDNPTVLYIGRLEKRKGVNYLIRAFADLQLELPNAQLLIAGDGPDKEKLTYMVDQLGVENVSFLGFISDEEKLKLLHSVDVFCSPAIYGESFGIVLLEAMAAGVPIVAGDNPGYSAVMAETGRISLVNPKDYASFARSLSIFLQDKTIRKTWQKWASPYVAQFDYPNVVDSYENLYKKLCKRR